MPLSDSLIQFLRNAVTGLGDFAPTYLTPLRAFLAMDDEPEKIQSVIERGFTIALANEQLAKILTEEDPLLVSFVEIANTWLTRLIYYFSPAYLPQPT